MKIGWALSDNLLYLRVNRAELAGIRLVLAVDAVRFG